MCVARLHTGVVPPHCAFDVHGTHVAEATSHTGVGPEHNVALVAEQTPHPPDVWHAGVAPPHSLSPPQPRQVCVLRLHTGVLPEQSAFPTQGTQVPEPTSHTGAVPMHSVALPAEHWPHAPLGWQAGVVPPHSLSPPQPRHTWNAGSQIGVAPPQSALPRQPTHSLLLVLQTGVAPPQWALVRHCTQAGTAVSHTGVAPEQRPLLVAEHTPHAPDAWHAGALAGHCPSAAHAWHVCVAGSQTGVVPPQFVSDRHATHRRGDTLPRQCGVAPLQSLDCAHCSTNTLVACAPAWAPSPSVG
jgi:hypothetical protein